MNIELTEAVISTNTEPTILRDSILTGFGVRIYPSGKVSYFIEPTINGKSKRKVIGKYPDLSVSEARVLGEDKIQELTSSSSQYNCDHSIGTMRHCTEGVHNSVSRLI